MNMQERLVAASLAQLPSLRRSARCVRALLLLATTAAALSSRSPALGAPLQSGRPSQARPDSAPSSQEAAPAGQAGALLGEGELRLLAAVSEETMQARVRQLVSLGTRMGGTRSGARAVAARVAAFGEMQLACDQVVGPERLCHEETEWHLRVHAAGQESWEIERAWPWGFSPSAQGRVRLGLEEQDGQALLRAKRPRGRIRAQPAVVLYDAETTSDGSYPVARSLQSREDNPYPVFGIPTAAGERLREALLAGEVELEFELVARIVRAPAVTVVGRLPAREGAEPGYLLFCAHGDSDSGGPGANDNGSGEAIVLEIARVLSRAQRSGELAPLGTELRFALWGSEIFSTRHYLDQVVAQDAAPILGVINYDQSGFGSGSDQLNLEPDDLPANKAMILLLAEALRQANGEHGLPAHWATNKSLGGTDSYIFSSAELFEQGLLPSITIYVSAWDHPEDHPLTAGMPGESWSERDKVHVDFDLYYHSAGDLPENTTDTEAWNMGWCARLGLLAVTRFDAERAH